MAGDQENAGGVQVFGGFGALRMPDQQPVSAPGAFRIAVIGDLGGRGDGALVALDREEFNALPGRLGVTVEAVVPNHLGSQAPSLAVSVPISSLKELDPRHLLKAVPELATATAYLETDGRPAGDVPPTIDKLAAAVRQAQASGAVLPASESGAASASGDGDVDRILGMVEAPSQPSAPTTARAAVSAFVSAVAGDRRGHASARPAGHAVGDGLVEAQLREILQHPRWVQTEAAWRGLKLLLASTDARAPVAIEIADVRGEVIVDRLPELLGADDGFHQAALGVAVVLGAFGTSPRDLDRLDGIAKAAERAGVPVLVSLAADALGAAPQKIGAMDDPGALLDAPGYGAWRGLRGRDESRSLAVFWNDVLLRPASVPQEALWGEPALVAAALILRSVARTGWPSEILGMEAALGGLEVAEISHGAGRAAAAPVRALVSHGAARSLARAGVAALAARPDRDQVFLVSAPIAQEIGCMSDDPDGREAERFASLPFALVAARLQHLVGQLIDETASRDPADMAVRVERRLADLLLGTGAGSGATVQVAMEDGAPVLDVALTFGQDVLGGVELGFQIPCR